MNRPLPPPEKRPSEQLSLSSTIDLFELLWRRKLIVIVTCMATVAAGLAYYFWATPIYESTADVLLVPKRPEVVTGDAQYQSSFEDYVATHRALIVSPLIVKRAIDSSKLDSLKTFAWVDPEEFELTDVIIDQLTVDSGPRDLGENADSIMTLGFQGTEPDECPLVVEAVLNSYKAFLSEIYRDMSDDTMRLIGEARDLLKNDLQQEEQAYIEFRQQSPLVARGTDEVNPLQDRLTSIEQQRTQLLIRRADLEGQLTSIEKAKQNRYDDQHLLALVTDLRNQATADNAAINPTTPLDAQLVQLADREQELLEHFGPNHPRVATVRQRIAAARKLLALPSTAYIQDPASPEPAGEARSDAETVDLYTKYLEQELERIKVSEQLLTELYQQEHETAKELSSYQLKDEGYRRNIDRTQQLYDGVVSQLQDASLIKSYGGFEARVIAEPLYGEKVSPRGKLVVAAALLAGMCIGFVLAVVGEMRDQSFHSRHEIQSRLGVAVMAQIPRFAPADAAERGRLDPQLVLAPMLCVHFQPRSPQTEAFDSLRTTLLFHQRSADRRVIQITSPSPDDGKSTIAANLAVTIAQLGRRVLVLDADLLRPRQHEIFGISADKGLCSLIREGHSPSQAIYATSIEGLSVLPVGPDAAPGPELFMSTRFAELLTWLRSQFDDVLIDSGPLLAVSDPCIVASQVDGVLLALKPTKDSRRRAERAKELLDAIDVVPIGVVVNGVGSRASRAYRDDLNLHDTTYTASVTNGAKRALEQPGVSGSDIG